jgi:tRNA A37 threonylcarbamoyladenosine synthetase subunit TsaC/SUA5/YrdC
LFGCLQCNLINKNAVLNITQIRAFPLYEPLVSHLQVIVRVSCHRVEGWLLY